MPRAWRSVEKILFWVYADFEGNDLDVLNGGQTLFKISMKMINSDFGLRLF